MVVALVGATGCGQPQEDTTSGSLVLTVYTSGELTGTNRQEAQDAADAAKLALEQANGMSGPFTVNVVSFDDTDPDTGRWGADQVVGNARRAIADRNIIAYITDSDSGAAALSLPLLNEAGVLQIGPTDGYVGLTRTAGRGEPERFYPSGLRTFGRIAPADDAQAQALVDTMQERDVRRLAIIHDGELEALGLTTLVTRDAQRAGIDVVTEKAVDHDDADQSGTAKDVVGDDADAALYAGSSPQAGARVLDALHAADEDMALYATDGLADDAFASTVRPDTARELLITSPAVPLADLPAKAAAFGAAFRRAYDRAPVPAALFSYEATLGILDAVKGAGTKGNDRTAVIKAFFALREHDTALGSWAMTPSGDSTVARYGIWRVRDGRLSFVRELRAAT